MALGLKDIRLADIIESKEEKIESISKRDIAIIGMVGEFAFAKNVDEFWQNLRQGKDCVRDFPSYRRKDMEQVLMDRGVPRENIAYFEGAYYDEVDKFDHGFFRLSPKEASLMDPNQRMFLEKAWEVIEAAGYGGEKLVGSRTGVYVGYSSDFGESYGTLIRASDPESTDLALPGNIKSIIASRISYLLDLKGPSIMVDTACSSSLTAVHFACQGIRNGECDLAIAGGIKVNLMPVKGREEGIGIESAAGRAKTFDDSSDGTGFGEGVAVILLKPLKKALEDNDFIHAVIKGSAVNQDGSSIGITAPNSKAQQDVITRAWKDAGINPETISFIEAHGTGTKLGDPIEIEGIEMAFREFTRRKQFCAVGSVKTNIGHPDHAAGIAGLVKAVMALRHREIPPSLHFKKPNRKIDFTNSPVYVNDKLGRWNDDSFPMRCGISSFGLSGTNCHVVLEEYRNDRKESTKEKVGAAVLKGNRQVIALSAKNEEVLMNLVNSYISFMEKEEWDLGDICYTANTGRGHYTCRLAFLTDDRTDFIEKLKKVKENGLKSIVDREIFYGKHKIVLSDNQKRSKGDVTEGDKRKMGEAVNAVLRQSQGDTKEDFLGELCRVYIEGGTLEWELLYKGQGRKKVILPVYPFQRIRCWVEKNKQGVNPVASREKDEVLHPLLEKCAMKSMGLDIYETIFRVDKHWVLNEHRVVGSCVVPGTTYLELAREIGSRYFDESVLELRDILFLSPLIVHEEESKTVQTLVKDKNSFIEFEVVSKDAEKNAWVKHVEGRIYKNAEDLKVLSYSLDTIKNSLGSGNDISYDTIKTDGVDGGPRFRNLRKVHIGRNEVLACLELDEEYLSDLGEYLLHPALMDSAVNMANHNVGQGLYLPLSYKNLKIFGPTPSKIYSYLRKKSRDSENPETASFDISILDESGRCLVEIEGFTIKRVHDHEMKRIENTGKPNSFYEIGWKKKKPGSRIKIANEGCILVFKDRYKLAEELLKKLQNEKNKIIEIELGECFEKSSENKYVTGSKEEDYQKLIHELKGTAISKIIHMGSIIRDKEVVDIEDLQKELMKGVKSLFYLTRSLINHKRNENMDIFLISDRVHEVSMDEKSMNPHGAALFGLGKVIGREHGNFHIRCIDMDDDTSVDTLLYELEGDETLSLVAYRNGSRYVEEFRQADMDEIPGSRVTIKENGVYLITGGLGGIGLEISRFLASKNKVKLCLVSRSQLPDSKDWEDILKDDKDKKLCRSIKALRDLEAAGSIVIPYSADVSKMEELEAVLSDVRKKFGRIDGIIHCAGVAGDGFVLRKDEKQFDVVLAPKILGTFILDHLTRNEPLDFFILFSSISSIFGAAGQGDYTAANAYLDSYAAKRNKTGGNRTLSINWPQWKDTGMAVDYGVSEDSIFKSVTTNKAMHVLDELVGRETFRIIPGELNYDLIASMDVGLPFELAIPIRDAIGKHKNPRQGDKKQTTQEAKLDIVLKGKDAGNYDEIEYNLAKAWSGILGLSEIDIHDNFYDLGGDSIRATKLLKEMEKDFEGIVDISDIFTYPTINDMSNYIKDRTGQRKPEIQKNDAEDDIDSILSRLAKGEISVKEAGTLMETGEEK